MSCSRCSADELIAERSVALDHAIKKAKEVKEQLGAEVDTEFVITLACYLAGIGLGGD